MLGLALEGGGAKGAFHMGAVKAFYEAGYIFQGVTGTSIGALNGALIAQGDFQTGYDLWETMDNALLYDIEQIQLQKIINNHIDKDSFLYLKDKIKDIIDNKGLDTSKMKQFLDQIIDEEKLRKSKIDFGLVTVSVTDLKPLEIYKEDIPQGKMTAYLMASANFPVFKIEPLEGKYYIDGGFYDNCPINLLVRKGYKEIIAIRTQGIGIKRKIKDDHVKVTSVIPSENLGLLLNFDNNQIKINLKMGYCDAMRVIKKLKGKKYYIEPVNNDQFFQNIITVPEETIQRIGKYLNLPEMEPKRMLFEKIFPFLAKTLKLPTSSTYQDIVIRTLEYSAENRALEKYQIQKFSDFLQDIRRRPMREKSAESHIISSIKTKTKLASVLTAETVLKQVGEELSLSLHPEKFG